MKEKIVTKNFIFVFISTFFSAMVMYTLMSTITEYASAMGAAATIAGLISGIYVLGGLCSRLYSGRTLPKIGWKKMAVMAMILHLAACCCYFFIDNIVLLIIVRFIHGLGFGASANATMTMGMSILPKTRYAEATGYLLLSTSLAVAVGPYIGGIIYDNFASTGCFIAATVFSFLMLAAIFFVDVRDIDPGYKGKKSENDTLLREGAKSLIMESESPKGLNKYMELKALPVSLCILMVGCGYASVLSFYRLYSSSLGMTKEFSYIFLIYAAVLILSRLFSGKIQDSFGDNIVCIPGIIIQAVGLILIAVHPSMLTIAVCAAGCALGFGTLSASLNVIACGKTRVERRSYAVTTFWICCDGGVGIGPFILGAIAGAFDYSIMYIAAALISLIALPIYYLFHARDIW
ncbi:MAG: MFS transporter [Firmicutes bacterium]|nr:MFS transporter [Bacillota bacterium]